MDAGRFDALTRSLVFRTGSSRRTLFGLVAVAAPILTVITAGDVLGKKKRKNKKKKKRKKNQCSPACTGARVCANGSCVCPSGTEECGGECRNLCPGSRARNPFTCDCCKVHGVIACQASGDDCCSDNCIPVPLGIGTCQGLAAGAECTFGAQCISGNCNGFCGT